MLEIEVHVPQDREYAGRVRILAGSRVIAQGLATASANAPIAERRRNPRRDPLRPGGHAPFGRYALRAHGPTPAGARSEYGDTLALFEPVAGEALDAESFGRLTLLVYAGDRGPDQRIRRTQGGVRLDSAVMAELTRHVRDDTEVTLEIAALRPRPWWMFWRRNEPALPHSDAAPLFDVPPFDEPTLSDMLSKSIVRATRPTHEDPDHERDRHRDTDSGSSSGNDPAYRGGGGSGGGGGASGAWSSASSASRAAGVDAAGRIVAAAGAAAVAAAAINAAAQSRSDDGSTPAGDSGSGDSPDTRSTTAY